ncbi:MAG: Gfo/Idh/MocA family oxidoreductase [Clostridiales bacterium]|nr:Gfo/Idh/MocA family oxidoreductase [Clostridiales bacterium]
MKKINVAIVGLGGRGKGNLSCILHSIENIVVTAVCDVFEDRCDEGEKIVVEAGGAAPYKNCDYTKVISRSDVDVVMVFTSWETHIKIAIDAMKAGKAVGMEVGGAASVDECWDLVHTWEETKVPFMMLENCCFGRNELMVRNMVRSGLFGEIVHCHGAYAHDLREEVSTGKERRHYRLNHYLNENCDNYPTHDLGPIAKILDINRGNRMVRLVSMASKAAGLKRYIKDREEIFVNKELIGKDFAQGDIVNTLITCENGETISLTLDTTLPRSYSREFTVRGTRGMYEENTNSVYLDGEPENFITVEHYQKVINNAKDYEDKYLPESWKKMTQKIKELGHDGMDYFEFCAFFDAIANDKPMPVDVYDAASWMCISALTKESIAKGNIPMEIPDFTCGAWKTRKRFDV